MCVRQVNKNVKTCFDQKSLLHLVPGATCFTKQNMSSYVYMGRLCLNLVWAITFYWSALTNWNNHSWTAFWSPFQVASVVSLKRASKMQFCWRRKNKKMNFTNYFQLAPKGWPAGAGQQWCHDLNHISNVLNSIVSLDFHLLDTLHFYTSPIWSAGHMGCNSCMLS